MYFLEAHGLTHTFFKFHGPKKNMKQNLGTKIEYKQKK